MGAIKLNQIDSYRPCFTQQDIESIHKVIIEALNIYSYEGYKLLQFECANGIKIDIEVDYDGFNYRRIQLKHTYVMYLENDEYKSIEEYETSLSEQLYDSIGSLNTREEEEHEHENKYQ